MKILLVCFLAFSGTFALPQNEIDSQYYYKGGDNEISNAIEQHYDIDHTKPAQSPSFLLYKAIMNEVMTMNPSRMKALEALAKSAAKLIIKSIEVQSLLNYVEETLNHFQNDPEIRSTLSASLDSLQALYDNADDQIAERFITWIVSLYSDEATARSFSSLMDTIRPTFRSWVVDPMKKYYRSFITPTIASITTSLNSFFGEELSNEIARNGRWSTMLDLYIARLYELTEVAKQNMKQAAQLIEDQEGNA
ncbi:UNVERIFIED_CONTAM: hypothetical protein RMT77_005190 [Armadillidium vulgare]